MDKPKVYDQQGQEKDWDWLVANFGPIELERTDVPEGVNQVYRIVEMHDREGPAVQIVHVADQEAGPMEGITVVRYWPGAPPLDPFPPPASTWRDRGVHGETNINGEIGFGMGTGDYYFPPSIGASAVWVADQLGPSDFVHGLGMLGATNHRHLEVYYQLEDADEPTPPEPPEPPTPPSSDFEILDKDGQPQDTDWLETHFGTVEHYITPEPDAYRLVKLQEVVDVHECKVTVLDENEDPAQGLQVSFRRRDGMGGTEETTDASGVASFPLGEDAKYPVPGQGPYLTSIKTMRGNSDAVIGLGRVSGTPRHLDVTFQMVPGEAPSPPPVPPQPPTSFRIIDKEGQTQDAAWLVHYFGTVEHYVAPETDAIRLVELREVDGVNEVRITLLNSAGGGIQGLPVSFRRRDGTAGQVEVTDADGVAHFPLESDASYPVPGQGPYLAMLKRAAGNGDAVIGLGRVMGTSRHLDVTFQYDPGEGPPPEPEPEPDPDPDPDPEPEPEPEPDPCGDHWDDLFAKLDTIIGMLEEYVDE